MNLTKRLGKTTPKTLALLLSHSSHYPDKVSHSS